MPALPIDDLARRAVAIATRIDRLAESIATGPETMPSLASFLTELATLGAQAQSIAAQASQAGAQTALNEAIGRVILFSDDAVTVLSQALAAGQAAADELYALPEWQAPAYTVVGEPGARQPVAVEITLPQTALDSLAALRAAAAPLVPVSA